MEQFALILYFMTANIAHFLEKIKNVRNFAA